MILNHLSTGKENEYCTAVDILDVIIEQGQIDQFPKDASKQLVRATSKQSKLLGLSLLGRNDRFAEEYMDRASIEILLTTCIGLLDSVKESKNDQYKEIFQLALNAIIVVSANDSFTKIIKISNSDTIFVKIMGFILNAEKSLEKELLACCLLANILIDDSKVEQFVQLKNSREVINSVLNSLSENDKSYWLQKFHFFKNLTKTYEGCAMVIQNPRYYEVLDTLLSSFSIDLRVTGARIALNIATNSKPSTNLLKLLAHKLKSEQEQSLRYSLGLSIAESVQIFPESELDINDLSIYINDLCQLTLDSLQDEKCSPYVQIKFTKALGVLSSGQYCQFLDSKTIREISHTHAINEHVKANIAFISAQLS